MSRQKYERRRERRIVKMKTRLGWIGDDDDPRKPMDRQVKRDQIVKRR